MEDSGPGLLKGVGEPPPVPQSGLATSRAVEARTGCLGQQSGACVSNGPWKQRDCAGSKSLLSLCAHVQASRWPSTLLSAFLRSLSLLSGGSPRTAPLASLGAPPTQIRRISFPSGRSSYPASCQCPWTGPVACTPAPRSCLSGAGPQPSGWASAQGRGRPPAAWLSDWAQPMCGLFVCSVNCQRTPAGYRALCWELGTRLWMRRAGLRDDVAR